MRRKPTRVREPIQVYLDRADRDLLDTLAEQSGYSRAELLRLGIRRLSADLLREQSPGSAMRLLRGVLAGADTPPDLAERHDDYLYGDADADTTRRG